MHKGLEMSNATVPGGTLSQEPKAFIWLRLFACGLIVALNIYIVIFNPSGGFSPSAQVSLHFLTAIAGAILFASTTSASLSWSDGSKAKVAVAGSFAVVLIGFYALHHFSRPEVQIAAYAVVDQNGQSITLEAPGQIEMDWGTNAVQTTYCATGNRLIVVFPEQLSQVGLGVQSPPGSHHWYRGSVSYVGSRGYTLKLGEHLK